MAQGDFAATLAQSPLPGADPVAGLQAGDWNQALRSLAVGSADDLDRLPEAPRHGSDSGRSGPRDRRRWNHPVPALRTSAARAGSELLRKTVELAFPFAQRPNRRSSRAWRASPATGGAPGAAKKRWVVSAETGDSAKPA